MITSELKINTHDIHEDAVEVERRIKKSLFERAIIALSIDDSSSDTLNETNFDLQTDGHREVEMKISEAHHSTRRGLSASGRTVEDSIKVKIAVPENSNDKATLSFYRVVLSDTNLEKIEPITEP